MTATHYRARRRRALPRLGWWWLTLPIILAAAIRTWPTQAAIATILLAACVIVRALQPRWLQPVIQRAQRITDHRALPARGRRTLHHFQTMRPDRFENAIAELALEDPRVASAHRIGGSNDRGADVIAQLHDGRRILIQCKRYNGHNVGSDTIQTINGVYRDIHHCHAAVIVTTSGFTNDAYRTIAMLPAPIRLIDGHALTAWANGAPAPW